MVQSVLPWILLAATLFRAGSTEPVAPESVLPAPGVSDPVFAYLVGLIDADIHGTVDERVLAGAVRRAGTSSHLPYRELETLSRMPIEGFQKSTVTATFDSPLRLPIPYSILGYHPGSVRGTREVILREYDLGSFSFHVGNRPDRELIRLTDVRLFGLLEGEMRIDIHGWIDRLFGGRLDDTRITGLVLFGYHGERWGMAVGYNREWKGRSGVLSLLENKIRFPNPKEMSTAAWRLRRVLESYEPSLRPDSLQANGGW
jgi:hypothetical protein